MADSLADALRGPASVFVAELRPPKAELSPAEGMDAWIDMYHAVRSLTRQDLGVFLTDSAVGMQEENNLRHFVNNLGQDVARERVVPFLTTKHSLEFCLTYAEQAWQHGFSSLVVLGGDRTVGRARCVDHAWQLRQEIRARQPRLALGGWVNPNQDAAQQMEYLSDPSFNGEFFLTQIVSHLNAKPVEAFLQESRSRGLEIPGIFGVFFYRSANLRTLEALAQFMPVPVAELSTEFASGASPVDVCARTLKSMMDLGVRHFYISNLPLARAASTMAAILERVGVTA
jgi:5,10-methylenetetrahydrofolate reductase